MMTKESKIDKLTLDSIQQDNDILPMAQDNANNMISNIRTIARTMPHINKRETPKTNLLQEKYMSIRLKREQAPKVQP